MLISYVLIKTKTFIFSTNIFQGDFFVLFAVSNYTVHETNLRASISLWETNHFLLGTNISLRGTNIPFGERTISFGKQAISFRKQAISFGKQTISFGKQTISFGHGFIGYPKGRNVERALGPSCPCVLCISHIDINTSGLPARNVFA